MGRLEPIDGKMSSWEGLWWHPEINAFTSAAIKLSDLRKYKGAVRLYVRKNKFFANGTNGRPNYHFSLRALDVDTAKVLEIEDEESEEQDGERLFTYDEVQEIINKVACYVGGEREFGEHLVSDFT